MSIWQVVGIVVAVIVGLNLLGGALAALASSLEV